MDNTTFVDLIKFWRDVEALSPQEIPKKAPNDPKEPARDWGPDILPPWLDSGFRRRPISPSKAWRHSLFGAVYDRSRFIDFLERRLGKQPDVFEERPGGQSSVFTLSVDENGRPLAETLMISMAAWAFGIVETRGLDALPRGDACDTDGLHAPSGKSEMLPSDSGFPGFDIQLDRLREELAWRVGNHPASEPIGFQWISEFATLVIEKLKLSNLIGGTITHRVKSVQVKRPKKEPNNDQDKKAAPRSDDDFLNSFFIKDLNRLITGGLVMAGDGLRRFLEPPENHAKIDVRKDRATALRLLHPDKFPEGCWPAEHPLVWSQQVAINAMWNGMKASGCFAVNGPPGTGKTTLLRDVVSAIVVERAKVLADRGARLLGEKRLLDVGGKSIPYYPLDPALTGFSIVVASSNNGAVENVSLELPKKSAIHEIWLDEVDGYRQVAGELLEEEAWALIAGRLGNKTNRNDFVGRFWWQKSDEENNKVPGLRERLEGIKLGKAAPRMPWKTAVERFNLAIVAEMIWRQKIGRLTDLPAEIDALREQRVGVTEDLSLATSDQDDLMVSIADIDKRLDASTLAIGRISKRLETIRGTKPGLLEWISSFGKSHQQWREDLRKVMHELQVLEDEDASLKGERRTSEEELAKLKSKIGGLRRQLDDLGTAGCTAEEKLRVAKDSLAGYWPDLAASDHDQERSSPWAHPEWRAARIRVFLAALNLHQAFIEENASKMMANLGIAMDMLQGGIPDPKVRVQALDSLAIACPVISTTFASVSSLCGAMSSEGIGWLLIDEAGQATPQAAAGAIWRARRVVVVGDPLQLEPVVTLPRSVEASLAACNGGVNSRWHPSRTSVQKLADQTTAIGTTVGESTDAIWVGAPLRVHRRCDEPMFSISNEVAYDGLMVHHKKPTALTWPASYWLDVPGGQGNGNWIPAEGEALRDLIQSLLGQAQVPADDIFLISPFRDVVRELKGIGKAFGLDYRRVGTVHTTQGNEADVVIMVLGGGTAGARDWASSRPNLLNVAASRAKARFYVVGDRKDWSKRRFFDVLSKNLG